VKALDSRIKETGVEQLLLETENYWSAWANKKEADLSILPQDIVRMLKRSLLIMRAHVDKGGGIVASCDTDVLQFPSTDTYSYVWPRDGAIVAMAFDQAGFGEVSRQFFDFCHRAISERDSCIINMLDGSWAAPGWHRWTLKAGCSCLFKRMRPPL
jgi:GH15 family glucan-1,4-alpha-glucosidase